MSLRIEDVRKYLSSVATWLTFDENTRFLKDERNEVTSEAAKELRKDLDISTIKSREHFNALSESLEDTDICRKRVRTRIERDKEMKKNRRKEVV